MITIQLPNSSPYGFSQGMAVKLKANPAPSITEENKNEICICDYVQCGVYEEYVFGCPGGEFWQQDKSDFLFRKLIATDTIDFELIKNGVKVADLNDNTYGTYFSTFPSGTEDQQLYTGYLLDWSEVYDNHGGGKYVFRAKTTILGVPNDVDSRVFNLVKYSDVLADGTVRIETTQNGNIFGNQFDFTGLNWYQSVRIPGRFGNPSPVLETRSYTTSTHKRRQIKDTMSREWSLITKKIGWSVAEKLVYNKLIANQILITDYNIDSESIWRRVAVRPESIDKPDISDNVNKRYEVTFIDEDEVFTKRSY